jgi:hypothetical protein
MQVWCGLADSKREPVPAHVIAMKAFYQIPFERLSATVHGTADGVRVPRALRRRGMREFNLVPQSPDRPALASAAVKRLLARA